MKELGMLSWVLTLFADGSIECHKCGSRWLGQTTRTDAVHDRLCHWQTHWSAEYMAVPIGFQGTQSPIRHGYLELSMAKKAVHKNPVQNPYVFRSWPSRELHPPPTPSPYGAPSVAMS